MAVRLLNNHTHPLLVDLRGGETLVLPPKATSPALLEELLYDNPSVREWEAAGWLVRLPARFEDTQPKTVEKTKTEDAETPKRTTKRNR